MKKLIIISVIILIGGYIFKEETFFINIKDTYYMTTYFGLSIIFVSLLVLIYLIQYAVSKIKKNKVSQT
jgi:hypothetical protein